MDYRHDEMLTIFYCFRPKPAKYNMVTGEKLSPEVSNCEEERNSDVPRFCGKEAYYFEDNQDEQPT